MTLIFSGLFFTTLLPLLVLKGKINCDCQISYLASLEIAFKFSIIKPQS